MRGGLSGLRRGSNRPIGDKVYPVYRLRLWNPNPALLLISTLSCTWSGEMPV